MEDPVLKFLHKNYYSKQQAQVLIQIDKIQVLLLVMSKMLFAFRAFSLSLQDFTDFYNYVQDGLNNYNQIQSLDYNQQQRQQTNNNHYQLSKFQHKNQSQRYAYYNNQSLDQQNHKSEGSRENLEKQFRIVSLQKFKQNQKTYCKKQYIFDKYYKDEQQLIKEELNQNISQKSKQKKKRYDFSYQSVKEMKKMIIFIIR
ncbi:unnamed protein product [Paramecium sonneborni]|uniref:Uncharacterized protein n=1 Tax=Paramecium sonneborni TaxID=65129 RepID=A0A8S1RDQ2_9CILI|nr:unnamed protein product [Paramecium sonneborni]